MSLWPEGIHLDRRSNAKLREQIDDLLILCRPTTEHPAVMPLYVARRIMCDLSAPGPVIGRLLDPYIEWMQ